MFDFSIRVFVTHMHTAEKHNFYIFVMKFLKITFKIDFTLSFFTKKVLKRI